MKTKVIVLLTTIVCSLQNIQGKVNDSLYIHRTISLDSVVITSRMPQVRNKGAVTKIMVANTMLANMGDAMTMLAYTPGLHDENGTIKVDGSGAPLYVVDGRILKNNSELETLQTDNIRSIEIDRSPSAEYSATGQPVIRITTKKHAKDYLYMKVGQSARQTRRFMYWPSLNMQGKLGKLSTALTYKGTFGGTENKETYFRDVYYEEGQVFHVKQQRNAPVYFNKHNLTFAADYNINKNNRLGLYYMFTNEKTKHLPKGTNITGYDSDLNSRDIDFRTIDHTNLHNITAEYAWTKGNNSFRLTQDVALNNKRSNGQMWETGEDYDSKYTSKSKKEYTSTSTNVKYMFQMPYNIKTTVGTRFNFVKATTNSSTDAAFVMSGKYSNHVSLIERNSEVYISLEKTLGKFTFKPDVTYQYVYRRVNNYSGDDESETNVQHFSFVLPAVNVTYTPNKDLVLSLSYHYSLMQPPFSLINAGVTFEDSLSYNIGNTALQATKSNRYNLYASWRDWTIYMQYMFLINPMETVMTQMSPESNILTTQTINFSKSKDFLIGLSYSHTFKRLTAYTSVNGVLPSSEYIFLNKIYKANKTSINISSKLNYKIGKYWYVFIAYNHQGYHVDVTMKQKRINALSVGTNATLLKNRLTLGLTIRDLLGEENYNNLRYTYGTVVRGTYGKNDMRGVTLRMTYTLFNKRINVKTRNQNDEIIHRM